MGTTHLNVYLRNSLCKLLTNCWMADLVVNSCDGTPLYDVFPEIIDQLKDRYAKSATVTEFTNFPLSTDQSGLTLEVTVDGGTMQTRTFSSPAMTLGEIYGQIKGYFTDCDVILDDNDHLSIVTKKKGPNANLVIGGTCDLDWGPVTQGSGYDISTRYYMDAYRINIRPPVGEYINHIEMDIPNGCYKIWSRCCFGDNEETSVVMLSIEDCGGCRTVNLLLPQVTTCSKYVLHPMIDRIVNDYQAVFPLDADKVTILKAIAYTGGLGREGILEQLNIRKQDAINIERTDLEARVDAVITIAQQLPQCC
jgi:hypothetical protein